MGAGIAQVSACAGYSLTLVDIKADVIESGVASIRSSLTRMVSKGRLDQKTSDEALDRIKTSLDLGTSQNAISLWRPYQRCWI